MQQSERNSEREAKCLKFQNNEKIKTWHPTFYYAVFGSVSYRMNWQIIGAAAAGVSVQLVVAVHLIKDAQLRLKSSINKIKRKQVSL